MAAGYNKLIKLVGRLPGPTRRIVLNGAIDVVMRRYAQVEVSNREILEQVAGTPTVFIANHLSNMDAVILNRVLKKNDVAFVAGIKLRFNALTKPFLDVIDTIPITPNSADREAVRLCVTRLRKGGSILIFPEGTRSRTARLLKAKKGFTLIARMAKAQIVPIALAGTEKLLPVNDNDMGSETLCKAKVTVSIGRPLILPGRGEVEGDDWAQAVADMCMREIAAMVPCEYRGYYE